MVDQLDKDVYTNTAQIRQMFEVARAELGLNQRKLTPVTLGMRSVPERQVDARG